MLIIFVWSVLITCYFFIMDLHSYLTKTSRPKTNKTPTRPHKKRKISEGVEERIVTKPLRTSSMVIIAIL